jgi:hypothetical protein
MSDTNDTENGTAATPEPRISFHAPNPMTQLVIAVDDLLRESHSAQLPVWGTKDTKGARVAITQLWNALGRARDQVRQTGAVDNAWLVKDLDQLQVERDALAADKERLLCEAAHLRQTCASLNEECAAVVMALSNAAAAWGVACSKMPPLQNTEKLKEWAKAMQAALVDAALTIRRAVHR